MRMSTDRRRTAAIALFRVLGYVVLACFCGTVAGLIVLANVMARAVVQH